MSKIKYWQLKQRQSLPLEVKIKRSQLRIKEFYEKIGGKVYVSFSGGKDSTVLLHMEEIYILIFLRYFLIQD
jgi:3'-phosphoadenosine 5'-phosphosulfate sulfotransferase (PAPS reductase)/FAD synthetase